MHVTQCWKQIVDGDAQYTRVIVPRGQEQNMPRGARKLTPDAWEDEVRDRSERRARDRARSIQEEARRDAAQGVVDVDAVVDELNQLGLSSTTVEVLTRGVSHA